VGEAFDKRQRGLAVGIYTMGATVGAVIALPIIVAVTTHLPWRSIFLLDGLVGLLWVPVWFWVYRGLKTVAPQGAVETTAASTKEVLRRGATWKLMIARGMTDPVWYFFLFWFPKYLLTARHMPMVAVSRIAWIVYLGAGVGTLLGGLLSGALVRRGMRVGIAYRWTMLAAAMVFPLSPLAALVPHAGMSIAIAALIALAHMAWLVTLTATMIELYPPAQIGKAVGLIAMGSGLGGMVSSEIIGYLVMHGGYTPIFLIMALLHPLAIVLLWKVYLQRRSETADIVPLTA
jgi:ACS family hexuronate transporter-like MFS transporter